MSDEKRGPRADPPPRAGEETVASADARSSGTAGEVFAAFLKLGLTSFGGPIAHLGYFHRELVTKRGWVSESQYGQLLALSQFLPGPSSSQVGFALGLIRAGWLGAFAAFLAFTLPSAAFLLAFASVADALSGPYGQAAIHGLKLVAVAVVADGVRRMAGQLTPDAPRRLMAALAAAIVLTFHGRLIQLAVVAGGAIAGLWVCRRLPRVQGAAFSLSYRPRVGAALLGMFGILLVVALALSESGSGPMLANASAGFYRAGALVFGGGHVVLPLLQQTVVEPGWVTTDEFLAGYGAAQAVPGPMFTLAAFLGARLDGAAGAVLGASVCLLAIMAPGLLLMAGSLPWWSRIGRHAHAMRALAGVNAAVVGLLAAALYQPVWTSAVQSAWDFAIALIAFVLLAATRTSTLWIVAWCIVAAVVRLGVT